MKLSTNKRNYVRLLLATLFMLFLVWVSPDRPSLPETHSQVAALPAAQKTSTSAQPKTITPASVPTRVQQSDSVINNATSSSTSTPEFVPAPNITLIVASDTYKAFVPAGSNVLDAMKIISMSSIFTYSGREYPSLGFFIDSIAGKRNEDGMYWFLYVNGKSSDTGASQTKLNAGDTIEWRYEKNR